MAVRGAKPKKTGGKSSRKPAPSKHEAAKGRSVLGNDPFERGAAVRAVALRAPVPGPATEAPPVEAVAAAPEPVPDSGTPLSPERPSETVAPYVPPPTQGA